MTGFGILDPDQVALVQRVFKNVAGEPWFAHSYENERDFAALVIHAFQQGHTEETELTSHLREIAIQRFSNKNPL